MTYQRSVKRSGGHPQAANAGHPPPPRPAVAASGRPRQAPRRLNAFAQELRCRLAELEARGLRRVLQRVDSPPGPWIEVDGRHLLNFASNDYLGLANHPALRAAAMRAVEQFGAGAAASRLICGSLAPHHALEEALARFKGLASALSFASGYATALGAIPALIGPGDVVILDKLAHASLVDAARLSGAQLRVFAHNDPAQLEARLA